jgi:hypothetical protein
MRAGKQVVFPAQRNGADGVLDNFFLRSLAINRLVSIAFQEVTVLDFR